MSEDNDQDSKTEDPTDKKISEARKRGQVVKSMEVNHWLMITAALIVLATMAPNMAGQLSDNLTPLLARAATTPLDEASVGDMLRDLLGQTLLVLLLPFILLMIFGLATGLLQVGPLWAIEALEPKWSKVSLMAGIKRLFSARSVVELIKGVIKISLVAIVAVMVMWPAMETIDHFTGMDVADASAEIYHLTLVLVGAIAAVMMLVAALDYFFQRMTFMKEMRMTKQEVKDEFKQTEGDPHIKGKLKQLRMQRSRRRMMQNVPKADVVITNPTHYALALEYKPETMQAPVLLAKGADVLALKIKDIAREHNITIVENKALARAMYDSCEIDEEIPVEHYKAVAEVISYVFRLNKRNIKKPD